MTASQPAAVPADRDGFYVLMAYTCAAIAFAGFTPTYWAPLAAGSASTPALIHLHGLLFSAWTIFFIVQATLVSRGRIERHRALGLLGIALATAMFFVGIAAQIHSIRIGIEAGLEDHNRAFSIVPVTIILTFAVLVAAAIANIARPDIHRRLMLVATVSILPPAFARLIALAIGVPIAPGHPPPLVFSLAPNIASDMLIVIAMIHDWRTRGAPHRAYVIAGACVLAIQLVRVPLGPSDAWRTVTDMLLALAN
jgi:hypothetical protein